MSFSIWDFGFAGFVIFFSFASNQLEDKQKKAGK